MSLKVKMSIENDYLYEMNRLKMGNKIWYGDVFERIIYFINKICFS